MHQLFRRFPVAGHVVFLGPFVDALEWLVGERKFFGEAINPVKYWSGALVPKKF